MSLDEPTRRSLYDSLARSLGEEQADALMSLLPQYPLADLATRDDVHSLAIALRGEMAELRSELHGEMALGFAAVDRRFGEIQAEFGKVDARFGEMAEIRGEMAEMRGDLKGEITELRGELKGGMAEMRGEMAEMRGAIAKLSGELRAEFSQQVLTLGLVLVGLIAAVLGTFLALGFTGAFP